MRNPFLLAMAAASSCTAADPPPRFANQPVVWTVDDRRDVRVKPRTTPNLLDYDFYDRSFERPLTRVFEVQPPRRARAVNALDEVPDSTWFTNRIGLRDITPDEMRTGPVQGDSPEAFLPWTVHSSKFGGASQGLIITDARGTKYLLKFESPRFPEVESGADVITNRLLWACGYHVPEDMVVFFRPEDLRLAPDATVKNMAGETHYALGPAELAAELAKLTPAPDGRYRAVASRWLAGTSLGGSPTEGVREDDPNDRVPHELRRDLRGQYPIFAWLDYADLPQSNTLDMLVADSRDPRRHYVEHYRIDFDSSLGAIAMVMGDLRQGYAYSFDWTETAEQLVKVGFGDRPWQSSHAPPLRGVAATFTAQRFDPGAWKPNIPYAPFDAADPFDMFWGAKLVARFTRAQIHAAVEAAHYSDPRTVEYITDTLVARQRAVVAYWFQRVSAVDHFSTSSNGFCFEDLGITHGVTSAHATTYTLITRDRDGHPMGQVRIPAEASGTTCTTLLMVNAGTDDYTIVQILALRPGFARSTYVHVARDPATHAPRVIGIWRA
jgi:hypothetical protein